MDKSEDNFNLVGNVVGDWNYLHLNYQNNKFTIQNSIPEVKCRVEMNTFCLSLKKWNNLINSFKLLKVFQN